MPDRQIHALTETRRVVEALTEVRAARCWSQRDLADRMGTSQSWVCQVETGDHADPQLSTIVRMAKALGVTAALTIYDPHTGDRWMITMGA